MVNYTLIGNITVLKLVMIVGILLGWAITSKIFSFYVRKTFKTRLDKDHLEIAVKIINYSIFVLAFTWILGILGIKLSGLLVAGGILGIVLGFASQSIVGNLVSGVFLMIERPMKIGNAVEVNGVIGIVEDIKIISTTIRTWDGLHIRVPNEKIFTSSITNYVSNVARRFSYVVGIRYKDDAEKAIEIIRQITDEEPFALQTPAPIIFVSELASSSVDITVMIWSPITEWYELKKRLLWVIKKRLEANGIEIAFPQSVLWLGEENLREKIGKSIVGD
ncbi:MAG: mechanosensitive ion channel family protein [Candidatus Cloacimonetes bacterium]|nr:mechanosensitive ion channel family protein [Candidatus Cloacimonadota bacterium]